MRKKTLILLTIAFFTFLYLWKLYPASSQAGSFTFVAWGDTKSDTNVLKSLSVQIKTTNPLLTIYAGDLESAGFTTAGMNAWKDALNGGTNNGMFDITFPIRGNHDNQITNSPTGWQGYFNLAANAQRIGATNYSFLNDDLTYSFDYGNSRFIGIDVPGNVTQMTPAQITWLDQRLTDAESKSLTHAFFFWHGPIFYQANHVSSLPNGLVAVLNKHPIVSAGFFGHEHVLTYTHINNSRVSGVTHEFEQIVSGDAGAGPTTPTSGRYDNMVNLAPNFGGFATITVNGGTFTLNFYKGGTTASQWSKTITKSGYTPPPPGTPTITPTTPAGATRTPTPTQGTGATSTPTPTGTQGNVCTFWKN